MLKEQLDDVVADARRIRREARSLAPDTEAIDDLAECIIVAIDGECGDDPGEEDEAFDDNSDVQLDEDDGSGIRDDSDDFDEDDEHDEDGEDDERGNYN